MTTDGLDMQREFIVGPRKIEAVWHGPPPRDAPTLVLLHEGLGCLAMWRDFPQQLAERTGLGVFVYSRPGYGKSDPVPLPRPLTYMHDEALEVLPAVLQQAEIENAILIGHSDGASIATIYAGSRNDPRPRGLVLMAPHFFCEDVCVQSIAAAKKAYETTDLRARLARYHGDNVDVAFWGWNQAWLDPDFRDWSVREFLPKISVPMLIIQGRDDQYGTAAQIDCTRDMAQAPVEVLYLDNCRHSPQVDRPEQTLEAIVDFASRIMGTSSPSSWPHLLRPSRLGRKSASLSGMTGTKPGHDNG
jgi:pimeloyl-ACP methyl ester carboxylesterase